MKNRTTGTMEMDVFRKYAKGKVAARFRAAVSIQIQTLADCLRLIKTTARSPAAPTSAVTRSIV